jgi:hypothetical protein
LPAGAATVAAAASPAGAATSDVKARLGLNTPGLGSAFEGLGLKFLKPKPWA